MTTQNFFFRYNHANSSILLRFQHGWLIALFLLLTTACGKKDEAQPAAPQSSNNPSTLAQAPAPDETLDTQIPVSQLLTNAAAAFKENRVVSPAGNNAIEFYLSVKAREPDNVQSTQGLVDLFPLGVSRAEKEIADRNVEEAMRIIGLLNTASPESYTVSKLKARLAAAQAQIRRDEERLLQQEQAAQQQMRDREQAATAPARIPVSPQPAVAESNSNTSASSSRPPATSTAAPLTENEPAKPVGETKDAVLVRQIPPVYPAMAVRRRQEGWVEVRFNVGTDGKVNDAQVVRSNPPRIFDREALRAVGQWIFQPALIDGNPVSSSVSRRIEFKQGE